MKINDSIALGSLAGIVGSLPSFIFDFILTSVGIGNYYAFQFSGGVHLLKKFTDDPLGALLGTATWLLTSAILGSIIVYFMRFTGKDYWWLKGILISNGLMYIGIYGYLHNLGSQLVPHDITTNLILFINNLLFGITTAYLITRWEENILR